MHLKTCLYTYVSISRGFEDLPTELTGKDKELDMDFASLKVKNLRCFRVNKILPGKVSGSIRTLQENKNSHITLHTMRSLISGLRASQKRNRGVRIPYHDEGAGRFEWLGLAGEVGMEFSGGVG
eukprot:1221413-Amorphochlora_amoeboformis.AAC.1